MFTCFSEKSTTYILVNVDDLLITEDNPRTIAHIKETLHDKFRIKDLGTLRYFLGVEVAKGKKDIYLG